MNYFIFKDGQNIGPLEDGDVQFGIRSGRFLPNDLACREGESRWSELSLFFPMTLPQQTPSFTDADRPGNPMPPFQTARPTGQLPNQAFPRPANQPSAISLQPHAAPNGFNPYLNGDYLIGPRIGAFVIDMLIAFPLLILAVFPLIQIVGAPIFCLYMVSRDAIFGGQSIGKKLLGLRVVKADGSPFIWADSLKRNIVYLAALFLMIPWLGYFLHGVVAGPLGIVEMIMVLTGGQRLGDRMGNTYVLRA